MKQVLQNRSGFTVVRDVPAPPCSAAGVLVRTFFSAISSGTERSRIEPGQRGLVARAREHPELVKQALNMALHDGVRSTRDKIRRKLAEEGAAGYSSVGMVTEVGAKVLGLRPGDIVACAGAGHANHAEVVSVPTNLCVKVPEGVPLPAAALTTIAAIALHAIRVSDVRVGDRAAVIGCGLVGQIVCRLLRCSGAEVYALDVDTERVEYAISAGADHGVEVGATSGKRVKTLTSGVGVDQAIVTAAAATNDPLLLGAEILRDRGALTLVGDVPIDLPRGPMYMKELRFHVSRSYGPGRYDVNYEERGLDYPVGYVRWTEQRNMEAVLSLQDRGLLSLEDLVEELVVVDKASDAYGRLTGPPGQRPRGAIVLQYDEVGGDGRRTAPVREARPLKPESKPPTVGFIGCGSFAREVLVPSFRSAGARLEVVGGGSGPSADHAARHLGFHRAVENEDAVIEDDAVNVVVISNRHGSHARLAATALRGNKNVFCEKPLGLTLEELQDVLSAAQASAGILAVGFNRRFSPLLVGLRAFVRGNAAEAPSTAMYRVSAGQFPPDHWQHDLEQGGGRVIGEICHFLDALQFLADSRIVEVHAAGHGDAALPLQAQDNVIVTVTHANGSVGSIVYVAQSAPTVGKERLEAFGPGGIGVLDDYRSLDLHGTSTTRRREGRRQEKGHQQEVIAFLEAVRTGTSPVPLKSVGNVSLAAFAAVESMRTGLPVRLGAWPG
jgi:predicted dehydrogenase